MSEHDKRRIEMAQKRIHKWRRIYREAWERGDDASITKVEVLLADAMKDERKAHREAA